MHSQVTLVVQKYLSGHPEKLHLGADGLVLDALNRSLSLPLVARALTHLHPGHFARAANCDPLDIQAGSIPGGVDGGSESH